MYLSICIPTYNRSIYLNDTLKSIYFNLTSDLSDFEVIILDNCSNDNTIEIVNIFKKDFKNIIYYKNETNLGASINVINCLKMAKGDYIKIINDTALFEEDTLSFLLKLIKSNLEFKNILFFTNINKPIISSFYTNYSSFYLRASFLTTSILSFGIWNVHFKKINLNDCILDLNLPSLSLLSKNFEISQNSLVINKLLFKVQYTPNKGGYNLIQVFVINYLGKILYKDVKSRKLNYYIYLIEKNKLLIKFLFPWLRILKKPNSSFKFKIDGANRKMFNYYKLNPLFYLMVVYFFFFDIIQKLKK